MSVNSRRLPQGVKKKRDYVVVCEGDEETEYIDTLGGCRVWDKTVDTSNAKGRGNIRKKFCSEMRMGDHDRVVVFCDSEGPGKAGEFEEFRKGIDDEMRNNGWKGTADDVVYFGNPCTMQIILLHFGPARLRYAEKDRNAPDIRKWAGVKDYEAKKCPEIMKKITAENYRVMRGGLNEIGTDVSSAQSSNAGALFDALEGGGKGAKGAAGGRPQGGRRK